VSSTETRWGPGVNAEAIQAWDGPLFDRFVKFRHIVSTGLGAHGDEALRLHPPQEGRRVLDIGCGFGDTTQQIAARVGPSGEAAGVDAAQNFIEAATQEADVQTDPLGGPYDMAFSRMGTMFFISPVAALRNVRQSLVPGGELCMVVWRRREDNLWLYRAQQIVEQIVQRPEEHEEPTCGPGPFSMANADTVTDILLHAGWENISLRRCDIEILGGNDMDEAVDLVMSLGPAGEILRLQGDRAAHLVPDVEAALREGIAEFQREDGSIWAMASTWIVTATAPPA
jgi:SAM-dependent methyltransferase